MSSSNSRNVTFLVLLILLVTTTFVASFVWYRTSEPIYTGINQSGLTNRGD